MLKLFSKKALTYLYIIGIMYKLTRSAALNTAHEH